MAEKAVWSDLQRLQGLGYSDIEIKEALRSAKGDYVLAKYILISKVHKTNAKIDLSWTSEENDDWVRNIRIKNLAVDVHQRALEKSPIYIRVSEWTKRIEKDDTARIYYKVCVSLKDKRQWTVERSFREFYALYSAMPWGSMSSFQSSFPSAVFQFGALNDSELEQRRKSLEAWILEICLTESCVKNEAILGLLYSFVMADAHGGRLALDTGLSSPESLSILGSVRLPMQILNYERKVLVPGLELIEIPPSFDSFFKSYVPCKINLKGPFGDMLSSGSVEMIAYDKNGINEQQLRKDYQRDRVIIQGRRYLGSVFGYDGLLQECIHIVSGLVRHALDSETVVVDTTSAQAIARANDIFPISLEQINRFCRRVLWQAARTESAFKSHFTLSSLASHIDANECDITNESRGTDVNDEWMPRLCVIPESDLAIPIELFFSVKRKPAGRASINTTTAADWCLNVSIESGTVYRFMENKDATIIGQIRAVYYGQFFEFPEPLASFSDNPFASDDILDYEVKSLQKGQAWLLLDRTTSLSRRDL